MSTGRPPSGESAPRPARLRRRRGRARVLGTALAYERVGEGMPAVFVPPKSLDRRVWDRQVAALAIRYEVIRYDRRGYGRSAGGPHRHRDAEELAALLDALGIAQAALVGGREGAEVAMELAVDQPGRVRALVLASPSVRDLTARALREGHGPEFEATPVVEFVRTPAEQRAYRAASWRGAVIVLQHLLRDLPHFWPHSRFVRYLNSRWADVRVSERLAEVRAPTLVVLGEGELAFHYAMAGYLREGIPNCAVVALRCAALDLPLAAAEEFNRVVLAFLAARNGPPPRGSGCDPVGGRGSAHQHAVQPWPPTSTRWSG